MSTRSANDVLSAQSLQLAQPNGHTPRRRVRGLVAAFMLAGSLLALPGCPTAGLVNYPEIPGDSISNSVNNPPVPQVVTAALEYTVRRFPPTPVRTLGEISTEPFAVNLPAPMSKESVTRIIQDCSPHARALTESSKSLPVYHVSRIIVRGGSATVDIIRPVLTLPDQPTNPLYQGVSVNLRGLRGPWTVTSIRQFPVGSPDVPANSIVPEDWDPHGNVSEEK